MPGFDVWRGAMLAVGVCRLCALLRLGGMVVVRKRRMRLKREYTEPTHNTRRDGYRDEDLDDDEMSSIEMYTLNLNAYLIPSFLSHAYLRGQSR